MTIQTEAIATKETLNRPFLATFDLTGERIAYLVIFIVAVITRFYDLGARVMSHDESLHTLYSWNLYAGKGYVHDPLMHGPFLFHINALIYFLFGDNDFTARISVALFGIILVMLPYWFRPWLGKTGALATSFMILMSPGLMYYSRYIRHDIFSSVGTVFMVLALFQYMRTRADRWIYIGMAAVFFLLCTKEVSYIHGFLGLSFVLLTLGWESSARKLRQTLQYGLIGLIVLFGSFAGFLLTQSGDAAGESADMTQLAYWVAHVDEVIAAMVVLIAALFTKLTTDYKRRPLTSAVQHLKTRPYTIAKAVLLGFVIFALFHTTFFSNIRGLYTGMFGAILYWLEQHGVQRGGQPWYYYFLLIPLYEFLPLIIGVVGTLVYFVRRQSIPAFADEEYEAAQSKSKDQPESTPTIYPSDGGTFFSFILFWTVGAFSIYSWAGEKMPWLTVHMTLPLIFIAGHVIQASLGQVDWSTAYQKGGFKLATAILLVVPALIAVFTATPFQSQSLQSAEQTAKFIGAIVVLILLGWLAWQAIQGLGLKLAGKVALMTSLFILTLLTIRFAWMLNFINYDYPSEPLVYAHGAPDVKLVLGQIDELSRRTVGDKMIKVAYDNDSTWPLEWYMREYPNRAFYGENPNRQALDSPIVIVGAANENKVKPYLGDKYTRFNYRMVWWPVESYKGLTLSQLWQDYVVGPSSEPDAAIRAETVQKNRKNLANIIFYRSYDNHQLNQWPFVHRFNLYIRNDVLNDVWDYQSGPLQLTQATTLDPLAGKRVQTEALQVWGSLGASDGQFNAPRNVAVAPDGTIYVADSGNHRIQAFEPNGTFKLKWGSEGSGPGQFSEPWGIGVGLDGRVYVADTWNHRVQIFTPEGELVQQVGTFVNAQGDLQLSPGDFWGPRDIAFDSQGNFYVSDTGNKRIQKFTADGQFIQTWGGGGIVPGKFEEPVGLAIDDQDNIYVADTWNQRVQKFDADFNPLIQWDVPGWEGENIFNKPYLAIDEQNRLFASDPEGYRILAYDGATGDIIGSWGQYGQEISSVALPTGLATDQQGQVLVADADNNRIMKFAVPNFESAEPSSQQ